MKKNLIYIFILLSVMACLDDKSNYDYKDLNDFENWDRNGVSNVDSDYTLYPGEEILFEPKVRFSIDSLNPDASYAWYLGKEEEKTLLSEQLNYTYKAEEIGEFTLLFCATDNKTNVTFTKEISVDVIASWKYGWMVLSRFAGNESQLSMILSKKQKISVTVDGKDVSRDTVVYVGENMNIVPNLGRGPRRLVENFILPTVDGMLVEDEVMVLQESGPVELDGNKLTPVGYAKNEFFDGIPDHFDPVDAVLTFDGKWLLNSDNYIYMANLSVAIDLHSGFYLKDPSLNGKKVKTLLPYYKDEGNYLIVGIDENDTYFGIVNDGECGYNSTDYVINPLNSVGACAEFRDDYENDLFKEVKGKFIFHAWANEANYYTSPAYFSVLDQNGEYLWHYYELDYREENDKFYLTEESSESGQIPASIMVDYKCMAFFPWHEWLLVASSDQLHFYDYWENRIINLASLPQFNSEIVGLAVKDYDSSYGTLNAHLAVALKSGEVYIFEVKYDSELEEMELVELYHKDGFGEIVDIECKFGQGNRPGSASMY